MGMWLFSSVLEVHMCGDAHEYWPFDGVSEGSESMCGGLEGAPKDMCG